MHRKHPGQRHGQVVAQAYLALAAIKESIEEGVGLFAGLACEGLGVLEGRRGEGLEAEPLEHVGGGSNDALGEAHPVRQQVAKASQYLGFLSQTVGLPYVVLPR